MIIQALQFRLELWLCRTSSLPGRLRDWIHIRLFRRHRRHRIIKNVEALGSKVAIVGTWPRLPLVPSIQRLIDALRSEGWSVVLVANESPDLDRVIDRWAASADVVVRRANVGRDFGAYQCGFRLVEERAEFPKLERLAFFNDSVLYPPKIGAILPELLRKESPIASFFVNHQGRTHLQSFAVCLNGDVSQSSELADFWRKYFPSNLRRHAIFRGEFELSRRVLERWPDFDAVVTYERLVDANPDIWSRVTTSDLVSLQRSVEGGVRLDLDTLRGSGIDDTYVDGLAREAFAGRNVSHALGALSTRLLGVPLKLDLVKQGYCRPEDFSEILRDLQLDDQELSDVMRMTIAHGTIASLRGLRRQMVQYGYAD